MKYKLCMKRVKNGEIFELLGTVKALTIVKMFGDSMSSSEGLVAYLKKVKDEEDGERWV